MKLLNSQEQNKIIKAWAMDIEKELRSLKEVLIKLRDEGKVLIALLYGSCAKGIPHRRSDIDLAVFIKITNKEEEISKKVLNKLQFKTVSQETAKQFTFKLLNSAIFFSMS